MRSIKNFTIMKRILFLLPVILLCFSCEDDDDPILRDPVCEDNFQYNRLSGDCECPDEWTEIHDYCFEATEEDFLLETDDCPCMETVVFQRRSSNLNTDTTLRMTMWYGHPDDENPVSPTGNEGGAIFYYDVSYATGKRDSVTSTNLFPGFCREFGATTSLHLLGQVQENGDIEGKILYRDAGYSAILNECAVTLKKQ